VVRQSQNLWNFVRYHLVGLFDWATDWYLRKPFGK
jgi:hypothetical protein